MKNATPNRRSFLKATSSSLITASAVPGIALLAGCTKASRPAAAPSEAKLQTKESQAAMTPDTALQNLKVGNARFVAGEMLQRDYGRKVDATSSGQYPFAAVVGCIDSRSPIELIFDQGIGDIFAARVAGNFVNENMLGNLEFACAITGAKLIVIVGHTQCGAIRGACDGVELGHLTKTLSNIKPAVDAVHGFESDRSSANAAFVQAVADKNVELGLETIRTKSPILKGLMDKGELKIVGAMYDIHSGKVTYM